MLFDAKMDQYTPSSWILEVNRWKRGRKKNGKAKGKGKRGEKKRVERDRREGRVVICVIEGRAELSQPLREIDICACSNKVSRRNY